LNRTHHRLRPAGAAALAALSAVAFTALSGCGGGGGGTKTRVPDTGPVPGTITQQPGWTIKNDRSAVQPRKKWTILVYMNAANDLEEYGPLNVNQMEQFGSSADLNIVVQFKRIKGRFSTADGDWGDTRRYYVTKDDDSSRTNSLWLSERNAASPAGKADMGSPDTMQDFIKWGLETYPAERYCLVVWNHGAGWRSQKVPGANRATTTRAQYNGRGVSYDDEFEDNNGYSSHIETVEMPRAFDMGGGRKWDLLAFDSSLMQMAEVAYEIRDKARYIVGSQESPPGEGYPYDLVLRDLTANLGMDGRALGFSFARSMLTSYGPNSDITNSVLDTSKVGAIAPAVDALGSALSSARSAYAGQISNAREASENYAYSENRDLRHFLQNLQQRSVTNDGRVRAAVDQVNNALDDAILFTNHGNAHPKSQGLAIFLPSPFQYRKVDQEQADGFGQRYGEIAFAKAAPNWQSFLANGPQ
jgi:hypothetical protein